MNTFATYLAILGYIPVAITLVQRDVLSVIQAGALLIVLLVGRACAASFLRHAMPVFTFLLFVTYNLQGVERDLPVLLGSLLSLSLALLGLYIVARGAIRRGKGEKH